MNVISLSHFNKNKYKNVSDSAMNSIDATGKGNLFKFKQTELPSVYSSNVINIKVIPVSCFLKTCGQTLIIKLRNTKNDPTSTCLHCLLPYKSFTVI